MTIAPDQLRRPRDLSQIIDGAISLYRQNFSEFLGIAAVILPVSLVVAVARIAIHDRVANFVVTSLLYIPLLVLSIIVTAAIARAIADVADGLSADFNRAYRQVFDRLGALLLAALRVLGISLLLFATIVGIPFAIYLGIRWCFFPQAVVIEHRDSGDALSFSSDIVKGSWWRTFGIVIIVTLLAGIPSVGVGALFAWAAPVASALMGAVIATIVQPFTASAWTLLFFDLSSRESERVSIA